MDADTWNAEYRAALYADTEMQRAQGCPHPISPCRCGTCHTKEEL